MIQLAKDAGKGATAFNVASKVTPVLGAANQKKTNEMPPPPQNKRWADELATQALKK